MEKTIPEKLMDQAIKDGINLDKYSVNLNQRIQKLLKAAQDNIVAALAKVDPTAPSLTKWKAARLEKLNEQIDEIISSTYKDISSLSKKELLTVAGTQKDHIVNSFNKAVGADIFNVTLTPEGVKGIVENTLIDGNRIGEWWAKQSETVKTKLASSMAAGTQALQVGMTQGESIGELIGRIRGTKTTPDVMAVSKNEADALVRTSVMQVNNAVRQETYKANADVLNGVEIIATLDKRTCPYCRGLDGKRYDMNLKPLSGVAWPGLPAHFRCRCTSIPIVKSYEELAGPTSPLTKKQIQEMDAGIPIGMRASMNGPVAGDLNYNDWLLLQPESVQKEILGKGKWQLWKDNKLDMVDLIDNSGKPLTLLQLQASMGDILAEKMVAVEDWLIGKIIDSSDISQFMATVQAEIAAGTAPLESLINKSLSSHDGYSKMFSDVKQTVEAQKAARLEATLLKKINDPDAIVTFKPGQKLPPDLYKPVPQSVPAIKQGEKAIYGELQTIYPSGKIAGEADFIPIPNMKVSSGMIVIDEQTGKIWLCSPKNQFGGYINTFPKGTIDNFNPQVGQTIIKAQLKQTAVKEVFEETGLSAEPIFHLGDYKKTTSNTRYYVGVKTGGNPTMMGWESEAVQLTPIHKLDELLNMGVDKQIAKDFVEKYNLAFKYGDGDLKKGFAVLKEENIAAKNLQLLEEVNKDMFDIVMKDLEKIPNFKNFSKVSQLDLVKAGIQSASQKVAEMEAAIKKWGKFVLDIKPDSAMAEAVKGLDLSGLTIDQKIAKVSAETSKIHSKASIELESLISKNSFSKKYYTQLKNDIPGFEGMWDYQKLQIYNSDQGAKIAIDMKKFDKLVTTEQGNNALGIANKTGALDDLTLREKVKWIENTIKENAVKTEAVGSVNGKLLSDLTSKQIGDLSIFDASIVDKNYVPWEDVTGTPWGNDMKKLWFSLDTSVKQTYLDSWTVKVGVDKIPKDLLGDTEKVLLKQAKTGPGSIEVGKTHADLGKFDKGVLANLEEAISNGNPELITDNQKKLWVSLARAEQNKYLKIWNEEGFEVPEFIRAGKLAGPESSFGGIKQTGKEAWDDIFGKPEPPVKATLVKAGPKIYDLSQAEDLTKFKGNQSQNVGFYIKAVAQGKAPTKTQKEFFDLLTDVEKEKALAKIEKLKANVKAAESISPVSTQTDKMLLFDDLVKYGEQEGSNTGGYYYKIDNPAERYYVKTPANGAIANNEVLASKLYQAAGVEVPDLQFIDVQGRKGIASSIIDGVVKDKAALINGTIRQGVYDNFAVDAWLADWDVVGLNYDNLIIKDGVRAVRIDVGGSLNFRAMGSPKGKDFGDVVLELKSMRDGRTNPQAASIFKNIKKSELEEGVRKVLSVSDDKIKELVDVFGPDTALERRLLTEKLIARKRYIQEQFPDIRPNVLAPVPKDLKDKISDFEFKSIHDSRINGKVLRIDKDEIEDQQVLFWTEKDVKGKTISGVQLKLTPTSSIKFDSLVSAEKISQYDTAVIHDPIMEAMRGIAQQSRNGEALRAEKDIARAEKAVKTYREEIKRLNASSLYSFQDISELQSHYQPWIDILDKAIKTGPGKILKLEKDSSAYVHDELKQFKSLKQLKKETVAEEIKFAKTEGKFYEKKVERGFARQTNNILSRATRWSGDYHAQYYEAEVDGIKIQYWPNDNKIPFAFRGVVRAYAPGAEKIDIKRIVSTLEDKMKVNMSRASEIDKELLYLRQIAYSRNDAFGKKLLEDVSGTAEEQVVKLKQAISKKVGYDIEKSKNYNYEGVNSTLGTGKLNLIRPDLDGKDWDEFAKQYRIVKNLGESNVSVLEKMLNNGGEMVSTVERTRKGFDFGGWSPEADTATGGASYFFTRIKNLDYAYDGNYQIVWKPDILKRVDAISYPGDKFGEVTGSTIPTYRGGSIDKWKSYAVNSRNETNFKQSLTVLGKDIDTWICESESEVQEMIKIMKDHKYQTWPDGRPLEDIFMTRRKALERAKK